MSVTFFLNCEESEVCVNTDFKHYFDKKAWRTAKEKSLIQVCIWTFCTGHVCSPQIKHCSIEVAVVHLNFLNTGKQATSAHHQSLVPWVMYSTGNAGRLSVRHGQLHPCTLLHCPSLKIRTEQDFDWLRPLRIANQWGESRGSFRKLHHEYRCLASV